MDTVETWLQGRDGIITAAEAARLGVDNRRLGAMVAKGELVRLTRGVFASRTAFAAADAAGRHRFRTLAVLRRAPGGWGASHVSAAVIWGLPVARAALEHVHVARIGRGPTHRRRHYTVHGCYGPEAFTSHGGVLVVHAAVAVIGTATIHGLVAGVMAADAAQHQGLTTRAELDQWLAWHRYVPGVLSARAAVLASDPRCESPGESRLRVLLDLLGFDVESQFAIVDDSGQLIGRVDFLIRSLGVVVEFDGAVKYGGPADQGTRALVAEKHREDAIRALGYAVVRVTWADLGYPARVEARIREAARISRRAA